jgi:1-acyl-sn-glycerol-3-phosphate acyltransferase
MMAFRLLRLVLHLFAGLSTCALVFPLADAARREVLIHRWSVRLLSICDIRLDVRRTAGAPPVSQTLIVANHISWLDIFVINALYPCRFVAKSDIRGWPLIGWLCEKAGTIFIARGSMRDVRRIYEGLVASLRSGERVAFFPEGTTSTQGRVLPFHANLFEAAIEARVPIRPHALRYVDARGGLHPAVDFTGQTTLMQSILAILRATDITAQLMPLPSMECGPTAHRRELANAARESIAATLEWD